MQRDETVLQDIINAARLVIEFVEGFEKDAFLEDWKTGYDLIDWDEVWKTSTADVPDLLEKVNSYNKN